MTNEWKISAETEAPKNQSRRKAVKTIVGGVGALAAYHTLPVNWSTPIIEQIFLPAHAQTSGCPGCSLNDPCIITILSGNSTTSQVVVQVEGRLDQPIAGLSATITVTPKGAGIAPPVLSTTTDAQGKFTGTFTITGGPGITAVSARTKVEGVEPTECDISTNDDPPANDPPADDPPADDPPVSYPISSSPSSETNTNGGPGSNDIGDDIFITFDGVADLRLEVLSDPYSIPGDAIIGIDTDPGSAGWDHYDSGSNWNVSYPSSITSVAGPNIPSGTFNVTAQRSGTTLSFLISFSVTVSGSGPTVAVDSVTAQPAP